MTVVNGKEKISDGTRDAWYKLVPPWNGRRTRTDD